MGVGEWTEPRGLSGGFFISPKDAQILRLGSQPWQGQILQTPQCCSFVHIPNVFHSTEQKLHCYAFGTFHEPQVFYLKLKPKLLLLSAELAGHPLQEPEWKQGRPGCHRSRFQWTSQHLKVQRADLITGTSEDSSSGDVMCKRVHHLWPGHGGGVGWMRWSETPSNSHPFFTLDLSRLLVGRWLWFLWLRQIHPNEWLLPKTKHLVSLDQNQYFCALSFLLFVTKIHVYSWNNKGLVIE